jgi:DNA replication protein
MQNQGMMKWINEGYIAVPKVLFQHYKAIGLTEDEAIVLLHVLTFIESGNPFPTPEKLAARMSFTEQKCTDILRRCLQIGVLDIIEHNDPNEQYYSESYSLQPLWTKILQLFEEKESYKKRIASEDAEKNVYTIMEREFGRPLSPIECETLAMWLDDDQHRPELIIAALKEAVMSGKLNFRYIDRILFEWKKNGIRSVPEAKAYGEKFRMRQQQKKKPTQTKHKEDTNFPYYNWLEQP